MTGRTVAGTEGGNEVQPVVLEGGHVIDAATGRDGSFDLLIRSGVVEAVEKPGSFRSMGDVRRVDGSGKWIMPGCVDLHVHLREPGEEWKETVQTGAEAAVLGGYTSICCMPNTKPANDSAEVTRFILEKAKAAEDPKPETLMDHILAPTEVLEETGERSPEGAEVVMMVDAALHAVDEILKKHPEALLYGQDVGHRLGGVFREAATLADKYGKNRVFNTPIQEAYIVGSTAGMSAVGAKPIVEIQFADYIWPGVNQLVTELSKSTYLSMGKFAVASVIRVPTGAYGGGGPYHSGTVESSLLPIKGIKIAYPSNAADMKGLMKSAYYDPNPVVMFEHKGLYWSKVPGTDAAKTVEPDEDYLVPFGKARVALEASDQAVDRGESVGVVTYGMGVYWAMNAAKNLPGQVEVLDLRTLAPYDEEAIVSLTKKHGKLLVLTEETLRNSFAEALAGRISQQCFQFLDAPIRTLGSLDVPAVPLNASMEAVMLPNADKVEAMLREMLAD